MYYNIYIYIYREREMLRCATRRYFLPQHLTSCHVTSQPVM